MLRTAVGKVVVPASPSRPGSAVSVVAPSVTRGLIDAFAGHLPDPDTGRSLVDQRMHPLTDREREVLIEVARGRSNAEIAQRLGEAEGTVKITSDGSSPNSTSVTQCKSSSRPTRPASSAPARNSPDPPPGP